jgi:DNA-binding HxlR family transcriptional regulator
MRGYGQFCPIAVASEIFAERWTPLVVRELFCGSRRFNELVQGLPRTPKSVLVQRLRSLEAAGVIERAENTTTRAVEYTLTPAGLELAEIVLLLGDWGKRWGDVEIHAGNLDPELLMWDMHRRLEIDLLPDRKVVVQVDMTGAHRKSYWLVVERPSPSVCWADPGFDVDLAVTADAIALHRLWLGRIDWATAVREGWIGLDGPEELRRGFPTWLKLSVFAHR